MNRCVHKGPGFPAAALPEVQAGQSMVEFALILPVFLLVLLGGLNLGLAIRAQLQLSQVAQQAAQYLVHHPDYADPTGNYSTMLNYVNGLSSYQIAPGHLQVTVGTSTEPAGLACTLANRCVQQDTVRIDYPYPVIFPMIGRLSVGMLQGGTVNVGTTESTIAASHPVTNVQVCYSTASAPCQVDGDGDASGVGDADGDGDAVTVSTGPNQHVIVWTRPVEADPAPPPQTNDGLSLPIPEYCFTVYYTDGGNGFLPHALGCFAGPTSGSTSWPSTSNLYYLDTTDYKPLVKDPTQLGTGVFYAVAAQQLNGVQSAPSNKQSAPSN